ncbi:MAG: glycoside hydrolase family 88 protein [Calditrichaeota bacterium]|nr:glycoside hydrolase family 88 protein [Calditrichota bacterium]RQW07020.1 MAG: glycoside hydrolase family 88 protein [Calditrichota bacterium]
MKNLFKTSLPLLFLFFSTGCEQRDSSFAEDLAEYQSGQYTKWSIKMADSEMERRGTSLMYGGSDPKAKWRYTTGLFLKSLLDLGHVTGDSKYFEYTKKVIDSFVEDNGSIRTYDMTDYNLDKINSGKVLLHLYRQTGDRKYKRAAGILYEQLQNQPRTSEGGFWHKERYPWQMWLDGIYMSAPFYAEFGAKFGHEEAFEDVVKQIRLIDMHTRDAQTGLRYHGWDESNEQAWADPVTGCSPHFWGRAIGWYSMALVDVLDYLPSDYQNRSQIVYILNDLLKAVKIYQDESGLWYQIVDLGERSGNYLETSASAMFVYSIAKAVKNGYIDQSYREVAVKGYKGLIRNKIVIHEDSTISLTGICSVAGLGGDPYRDGSFEYYISEPVVANDLKGVGPFIMAGIQMDKLSSAASD